MYHQFTINLPSYTINLPSIYHQFTIIYHQYIDIEERGGERNHIAGKRHRGSWRAGAWGWIPDGSHGDIAVGLLWVIRYVFILSMRSIAYIYII